MKFWVFKGKVLIAAAIAVVLALVVAMIGFSVIRDRSIAVGGPEPIFQGNTGDKVVAISVNVDWGEEFLPAMLEEFKKFLSLF